MQETHRHTSPSVPGLVIEHTKASRYGNRRGHTLTEFIVVLAIMGTMTSLALYEARPDSVAEASSELFSVLQAARMTAITSRNPVDILFQEDGHTYRIESDKDNDGVKETLTRDLRDDFPFISLHSGSHLRFNPLGMETLCTFLDACEIVLTHPCTDQTTSQTITILRTGGIWIDDET